MKKSLAWLAVTAAAFTMNVSAEPVTKIAIFENDVSKVARDYSQRATAVFVQSYNMDDMKRSTDRLTAVVRNRVGNRVTAADAEYQYQSAFNDVVNSDQWEPIYAAMEASGKNVEMAIRYRIKKLPAIVINDSDVLYGVRSLKEAVKIFQRSGG